MKKIFVYAAAVLVLASCGAKSKTGTGGDKQAVLDSLKTERADIDKKIKSLEEEIALEGGDSTKVKSELVIVTPVAYSQFTSYIDLQAKVDADQNVTVTPQMPGAIKKIYVTEGQSVSAGSVLAELDNEAAKKQLVTLETQLTFAKDVYAKQKNLWDQKIGTEIQYLTAKNNVETLESQLAAANEQLQLSKLVSPISGIVDAVDIKVGQMASPGYNGIRVVNTAQLKVKGEVSESYVALVQTGDNVKLFFPDINKEMDSKVSFVSKVVNPQTRSFTTEAKISNDGVLKPNMVAVMKIADYENAKAIVVDVNMVQKSSDAQYVYVASQQGDKMVAERKTVTVGKIYNGKAEITSGLSEGDKVITSGYQDIVNGELIEINQ